MSFTRAVYSNDHETPEYEEAIVRHPNGNILLRDGVKLTQLDRIEAMLIAVIHGLPELESWRGPVKQMYPEFDPLK